MKFWITIFSLALFAGGTCLGVALQPKIKRTPPPPPPTVESPRYTDRLSVTRFSEKLDLSPEQNMQLDQILGETQVILEEKGRDLRAAHERSRDRVMEILTDEQKRKLDELVAAERRQRAESEAEKTVKIYTKLLDLSPDEAKAFGEAVLEAKNKRLAAYGQHKRGSTEGRANLFRDIREAQNKAIQKALSAQKYQRYLDLSELER